MIRENSLKKNFSLQARSGKRVVKVSKCGETYIDFYKLYEDYDSFLCVNSENSNPWISEVVSGSL